MSIASRNARIRALFGGSSEESSSDQGNPFGAFVYTPSTSSTAASSYGNSGSDSATATQASESTIKPSGAIIPFGYGRRQINGLPVPIAVINNALHIIYIFCEGEIDAFESMKLDDKDIATWGFTYETYRGTAAQTVCGLHSYMPSFTSKLKSTAYIYLIIPQTDGISSIPAVTAICRLLKVYDPRTGLTAYSNNLALARLDHLMSRRYGARIPSALIDMQSFINAANYFDALLGTSPQEKRYEFNYIFDSQSNLHDIGAVIDLHCLGKIAFDGLYHMVYAHAVDTSSPVEFNELDALGRTAIWDVKLRRSQRKDRYTSLQVSWTDPSTWEAASYSIDAPEQAAGTALSQPKYDLTGFTRISQANRVGIFLLNSRLNDMGITFTTHNDKGLMPYGVFKSTHSIGFTAKLFQASEIQKNPDETWTITAIEYDPAVFTETVVENPTFADTNLPSPTDTPTEASGLTLAENLMQLKDTTWISVVNISWTASVWPFVQHYEVWAKEGTGAYYLTGITTGASYELRVLKELVQYTVKIVTVSLWDKKSTGITQTITQQGKYLAPTWKTGAALTGTEAGDIVFLRWSMPDNSEPAIDMDISMYELKRGTASDTWLTATYLCHVNTLVWNDSSCPAGTWRYFLKAEDSVGNYTATALTCDIVVTLNPYLGKQLEFALDLATVTGSNIGVSADAITPVAPAYDTLGERFPGPLLGDGVGGLYTYLNLPSPASADGTTSQVDFGMILTGKWYLTYSAEKLGTGTATLTPKILLSQNGTDWTEYDATNIFTATARYAKGKFAITSSALDTTFVVKEPVKLTLQANPKKESGTASVPAGGSLAIVFSQTFASITEKILNVDYAGDGLDPRKVVWDSLTGTGGTLRVFDKNNAVAAGAVSWAINGI